jgi:uncharacterized protein
VKDILRYDKMVEAALRGVVREALARSAANGLPGAHHFYITFKTSFPGVELPGHLLAKHPEEMTVVLEHQYWDLEVEEERFSVTLSFGGKPERVIVPFEAILSFADPSVKFGLQFQQAAAANEDSKPPSEPAQIETGDKPPKPPAAKPGEVVTLDQFRKK